MKAIYPFACLLLIALCVGGTRSNTADRLYTFNYENVLGTSLELKIGARSPVEAERAEAAALKEIGRLERILSAWDHDSEFSRWMQTKGRAVRVSPELFEVLGLFDRWRDRTGGALDASAEVITQIWKAAEKRGRLPSADELSAGVSLARQTHWRLDTEARTAVHVSDAPLVLSSFTKSYIVDRAANAALSSGGVSAVVVNIGGDLAVRGAWTEPVEIADPRADAENSPPMVRLAIQDRAVATSGSYRRGFEIGGTHYSHIVDPRTGMPCDDVISSTVVARDAVDAGAMATAFSVLSTDQSRRLAASISGVEFLLVMRDGRQIRSPGWSVLEGLAPQAAAARPQSAGAGAWDASYELVVTLDLAPFGGQARRPYVAVWIEDADKFPVRTLALWYNKDRFLPELRAWYRGAQLRTAVGDPDISHSVSSATRSTGRYSLKWNGKDDAGNFVKAGKYTVIIEASREHGGYMVFRQDMDFAGVSKTIPVKINNEVASAFFDYRKIK